MDPSSTTAIVGLLDDVVDLINNEWEGGEKGEEETFSEKVARISKAVNKKGYLRFGSAADLLRGVGERKSDYEVLPVVSYDDVYRANGIDLLEARKMLKDSLREARAEADFASEAFADWEVNGVRAISYAAWSLHSETVEEFARSAAWKRVVYELSTGKGRSTHGGISVERVGEFFDLVATGDAQVCGLVCIERLRMFMRTASKRFQILLAADMACTEVDVHRISRSVWRFQGLCLRKLGNLGFEVGKAVESAGRCIISERSGGDMGVGGIDDLLAKYDAKIAEAEATLGLEEPTRLSEELALLCAEVRTVDEAVEFFGMMPCFGHPTINIRAGGRGQAKGRDKSRRTDVISQVTMNKLRGALQRKATMRTIESSGFWPRLSLEPADDTRLGRLWRNRTTSFDPTGIPLEDWATIRVSKICQYSAPTVWTDLLDDKALADSVSESPSFFKGAGGENRRLLTKVVAMEKVSPNDILNKAINRSFSDDEMHTCIVPKQEEHKVKGRFFSIETFGPRTAMKMLEEAASDLMKKIFRESSMILTRAEFDTLAQKGFFVRDGTVFCEFDLSDWNINWEVANTLPLLQDMDEMMGRKNFFTFQHWFFKESTVSVRVKGYPIKMTNGLLDDPDLCWGKLSTATFVDDAGKEGKQQKPWTMITGLVAEVAADDFPELSIQVVVQGDNLTVLISRRDGEEVAPALASQFVDKISKLFASIRQQLKVVESVFSKTVATYSKAIWVKGVEKASVSKWAASMKTYSVGDPWTVTSAASSLGSSAIATSSRALRPHTMISLAQALLLIEIRTLGAHPSFSTYLDPTMRFLLLNVASPFGGRPVPTLAQSIVRGAADPTSNELSVLKRLSLVSVRHLSLLRCLTSNATLRSRSIDLSRLIADPYSIPFDAGRALKAELSDIVVPAIEAVTENPDLAELLGLERSSEEIREELSKGRPMYASLFRGIADCCGAGLADMVVSRFVSSSTFSKADFSVLGVPARVKQAKLGHDSDRSDWLKRISKLMRKRPTPEPRTSFEILVEMRGWWGLGQDSFTGINNISPLAATLSERTLENTIGAACLGDMRDAATTRGPFGVYFGKNTAEKRVSSGFVIEETGSVVEAVKRLVLIASQLDPGRNLRGLISEVVRSICGESMEEIEAYLPRIVGGTAAHRYDDFRKSSFHLNCLPGPSSHFLISSNNAAVLADDIPLAVQEFYIVSQHILTLAAIEGAAGPASAFLAIPLEGVEPVVTASPEIPSPHNASVVPKVNPANPLVAVNGLTFNNILEPTPNQWRTPCPSPRDVRAVFRSLVSPRIISSVDIASQVFSSDVSLRPFDLDLSEFLAIPFSTMIEELALAAAITAVRLAICRSVAAGAASSTEALRGIVYDVVDAVAGQVVSYFGMEDPSLSSIRRDYGLAAMPGKSGGRNREATISSLILLEAEAILDNPFGRYRSIVLPSESMAANSVTQAWALFVVYSAYKVPKRSCNWDDVRGLSFTILRAGTENDDESRATNIVGALMRLSNFHVRVAGASLFVPGLGPGPVNRSHAASADLRRSLRGRAVEAPSLTEPKYTGGSVRWCAGRVYRGEMLDPGSLQRSVGKLRSLMARASEGSGSLAPAFVPVIRSVKGRLSRMISVGAGSGNWTVAGLECEMKVEEIELLSQRPRLAQEFANVVSADGQTYGPSRGGVSVHPATFVGGDILSDRVSSWVAEEPDALVVIDVQTFPMEFDYARLVPLIKRLQAWVLRVLLSRGKVSKLMRMIGPCSVALIEEREDSDLVDAVITGGARDESKRWAAVVRARPANAAQCVRSAIQRLFTSPEAKIAALELGIRGMAHVVARLTRRDQVEDAIGYRGFRRQFNERRDDTYAAAYLSVMMKGGRRTMIEGLLTVCSLNREIQYGNQMLTASSTGAARQKAELLARLVAPMELAEIIAYKD